MRYEEVQKAKAEFDKAKAAFDEVQNAYLVASGYSRVIDYDGGTVKWHFVSTGGYVYSLSRIEAIAYAREAEANERWKAENQIAKLKAEHGIGDVAK